MKSRKNQITYIVAIVLFLLIRFCVPLEYGLTEIGRNVLAIIVATIVLWVNVDIGWPSFLAFALFIMAGIPASELVAASWGSSMIPIGVYCITLAIALSETGVTNAIANWFISRKICKGRPYVFITMFLLAAFVLCMVLDPFPILILFCSMATTICETIGYKKTDKFFIALVIGLLWLTSYCLACSPIAHTIPLMMISTIESMFGVSISFGDWLKVGLPCSFIMFAITILLIRFVLRPDVSKYMDVDMEKIVGEKVSLDKRGKISTFVFVLVVVAWLLGTSENLVPVISPALKTWGNLVPPVLGVVALAAIKVDGKALLNVDEMLSRVPWKLQMFFVTVNAIGGYIGSELTGIRSFLAGVLEPITKSMSPVVFIAFIFIGCCVMTNFVSNAVAMLVFFYIAASGAVALGANPVAIGFMLAVICNLSVMIAPSCMYSAYIFGNDYLTVKDSYKVNLTYLVVALVVLSVVIYPLANAVLPGI